MLRSLELKLSANMMSLPIASYIDKYGEREKSYSNNTFSIERLELPALLRFLGLRAFSGNMRVAWYVDNFIERERGKSYS